MLSVYEELKLTNVCRQSVTIANDITLIIIAMDIIILILQLLFKSTKVLQGNCNVFITRIDKDINIILCVSKIPEPKLLYFDSPFFGTCRFKPNWFIPTACPESFV